MPADHRGLGRIAALIAILASLTAPGSMGRVLGQVVVNRVQLGGAVPAQGGATPGPAPANLPSFPPPRPSPTHPTLSLPDGGFVSGGWVDSVDGEAIRWLNSSFAGPLTFRTGEIKAVRWPAPAKVATPSGDYRFDLAGGGVLYGSLIALDEARVELDAIGVGRIHLERPTLHRLHRRLDDSDQIYSGPSGVTGWTASPAGSWREEAGQPTTSQPGVSIRADLGLPSRAVVEFELSWKSRPDFALALGAGADDAGSKQAFRFEVWDGQLIVEREADALADLATLGPVEDRPGGCHLMAYVDQPAGRILVVSPDGRPLADLTVPAPGQPGGWVSLTNVKGEIRLERLQIARWDGQPPRQVEPGRSRVHLADGTVVYGEILRFDSDAKEFILKADGTAESRVPAGKLSDAFLSAPAVGELAPPPVLAQLHDGSRLGGAMRKIEGKTIELAVPGIFEPVRLAGDGLHSLTFRPGVPQPAGGGRPGVLELEDARLPGSFDEGFGGKEGPALLWKPRHGMAAEIRPGVAGRIVYVEPKPVAPATTQANAVQPPRAIVVMNNLLGRGARTATPTPTVNRRALHLRTGDVIPCEVVSIGDAGVRIRSELAPNSVIPHSRIKAVELNPLAQDGIKVGKEKRERILTLPRMQKGSPPTQLIRSTNGDYLRGRVVAMDATTLKVEVRLENKAVPRDRVARIIWFHADELGPPKDAPAVAPPAQDDGTPRVQAIRADGVRLTFRPTSWEAGVLLGVSDVLGPCQVRLDEVDQLLIGPAIERSASQLAYGRWILRNAEEPKFALADGGGNGPPGAESPMVGKPAPDFTLDLLDGQKFHLAESRGQVVVLDFWATWCGPCVQAMPQVGRATKAFADRGVKLVSVNLQETPRDIKAMLERHKLEVAVALDRDGVVAERYAATAIPQTVIIDRAGTVARLFVGGGPDFEDRLRDALTATLDGTAPEKK